MHDRLEFLVPVPVTVGLLRHDVALDKQAFQHQLDVEFLHIGVPDTQRDILEITKYGQIEVFTVGGHGLTPLRKLLQLTRSARVRPSR